MAGLDDVVGREGYVQTMQTFFSEFDELETDYEEFIDAGDDRVLVVAHQMGIGRVSRAPVDMRTAYLFELEARCVIRVLLFRDRETALRAVGLSE